MDLSGAHNYAHAYESIVLRLYLSGCGLDCLYMTTFISFHKSLYKGTIDLKIVWAEIEINFCGFCKCFLLFVGVPA